MNNMTFLWHDYETFGVSPQKDLPCQFAAIRTDMDLNVIGKPINIMSQIANDYLPQPRASLVTGITPQQTLRDGMIEAEFAKQIQDEMATPGTCVVGYNSIRFDDEVSRYLFYRNFYDPYSREWRNGNSRWDIIDLARACYALRPEGIEWPTNDDGTPSFKLELLTQANNIDHGHAHDALSDVYATIGLAKLIKERQPKLFDFGFSLRSKQTVISQINQQMGKVLLHVSSKIPASQGCCTWIMPIAQHPTNSNAYIAIDLSKPIDTLLDHDAESIKSWLYAKTDELPEGIARPGLKLIHANKSPFITTAKAMTQENAERLGLDREYCLSNYQTLAKAQGLANKLIDVYTEDYGDKEDDVDHALYSGGFMSDEERRWCNDVISSAPENLSTFADKTQNAKLRTQLFRYRARNYPNTLTYEEAQKWQRHRQERLSDPSSPSSITLEPYLVELESLFEEYRDNSHKTRILKDLFEYAKNL